MARCKKTDKFYIYAPSRNGEFRGKRLFGVNNEYDESEGSISLQDLVDFLSDNDISLSSIELSNGYVGWAQTN